MLERASRDKDKATTEALGPRLCNREGDFQPEVQPAFNLRRLRSQPHPIVSAAASLRRVCIETALTSVTMVAWPSLKSLMLPCPARGLPRGNPP